MKVAEKKPTDIRTLSQEALTEYFVDLGDKPFRAKQVYDWLWNKGARDFEGMTNLSKATREMLQENFVLCPITLDSKQVSNDGTIKCAFRLHDGHLIEGVLIPAEDRMTACVSSQVGCSLSCKFCATGYLPRLRNLDPGEIYDQVVAIDALAKEYFDHPLTNIVYMGMGEPLLNYANVLKSVEYITDEKGLNMAPRRITVSTAGIAKMIKKLGDDAVKFNLALSLHAANDGKRNEIMPINESNTLEALRESLQYYYAITKKEVTFEYIVFHDFNDSIEDARELLKFSRHVPSKVNLIEYNPIAEADFVNTEEDKLEAFSQFLTKNGLSNTLRRSRGKDIDAACGQLANKAKAKVDQLQQREVRSEN
ncbi:MAG TPA: 23S rRNA (adenine(2503)-C(2))-methyltransferase RlmN [Cytophagales bacterium]|nr:23S rRNA (adenine(2503)-C(2))-methyltransferase RlmN [Cytophagales bacterium]HAA20210.1 23S rRNA (adenine(2503)-C(2))-methyltransferase RlmN [Cytophagales bacterium]HAP59474.1 23S rRNA (adenine(2503)-C(2))-methyltransferase RlmN [Cytophagales bacterium]